MSRITPEPVRNKKGKPLPPVRLSPFSEKIAPTVVPVRKILVVCNPVGGGGKAKKVLDTVCLPVFKGAGVEAEVKLTERPMHAAELAKTLPLDGVDVLCAIGGDGTLCELLTGFMQREDGGGNVSLGFIPGGTGNAIMREFHPGGGKGRPSALAAAEAIVGGCTRKADVMRSEYARDAAGASRDVRFSMNGVFWGLGTDANIAAEKMRWMGPLRYDVGIVREILKLRRRPAKLVLDGSTTLEFEMMLVCAMNTKYTGDGLPLSPYAQLDTGVMDIMMNASPIKKRMKALKLFDGVKAGGTHVYDEAVGIYQCKTMSLETPTPSRLNFDGENVGYTPLTCEIKPKAVSIIVPKPANDAAAAQGAAPMEIEAVVK